jgi:hypothetical protein
MHRRFHMLRIRKCHIPAMPADDGGSARLMRFREYADRKQGGSTVGGDLSAVDRDFSLPRGVSNCRGRAAKQVGSAHPSRGEVPDTHYSGWRWESKGLTSSVNLIFLFIGGTMITASVLSLGAFDASSIDACLRSPRDRGR